MTLQEAIRNMKGWMVLVNGDFYDISKIVFSGNDLDTELEIVSTTDDRPGKEGRLIVGARGMVDGKKIVIRLGT